MKKKLQQLYLEKSRKAAILATLRRYKEDGTGTSAQRKYQCASRLINYSKKDLEIAKADIEFYIQNSGTSVALLAAFRTVLSIWIPIQIVITTIFTGLGAYFLLFGVGAKISYLHILKIALARKSVT